MVVSWLSPDSVVVANCFLVAVPLEFIVVKEDKNGVVTFVLSGYVWFNLLDMFVSWCCADNLFWDNDDASRLSAGG